MWLLILYVNLTGPWGTQLFGSGWVCGSGPEVLIQIWICRLSKAVCHPQGQWASSSQLKISIKQLQYGTICSLSARLALGWDISLLLPSVSDWHFHYCLSRFSNLRPGLGLQIMAANLLCLHNHTSQVFINCL